MENNTFPAFCFDTFEPISASPQIHHERVGCFWMLHSSCPNQPAAEWVWLLRNEHTPWGARGIWLPAHLETPPRLL